ncbi:fungal specific transcription factor domain-containing protein [Aspergillus saccharolyticus JOP 1030-1]|uniref:Fungal-specific transcription factor n=1 Tax=Aspergillus saccharolyticus JOP 1030-1 TaxID=1450539 RepID=A0A318Z718_9EURO|nr:fungal-specific transcription factor [Aspergillus saccharolyticus JOP 1030-1]PYH42889.1 fungal-specific transcription factor [Aspergillus saccharolyticus JOP 1030-1]
MRESINSDQLTTISGFNPNISFFPAKRVKAINERLGHNRLDQLLEEIRTMVATKIKAACSIPQSYIQRRHSLSQRHEFPDWASIQAHISAYFEAVHPLYPFLSPDTFRQKAAAEDLSQALATDQAWAALFYAVVAIGCQNNEGGSFDVGVGEAWQYFERSLSYFPDLLFGRGSLTSVQALMAMAIFSSTVSAFQFEPLMLSEASIMAQGLGYQRSNSVQETSHRRTFWVLYFLEKTSCFGTSRNSVIDDANISCAIPDVAESVFDDYDWFFCFVKYGRLVSKIHHSLFNISAVSQPLHHYNSTVISLRSELETWRLSIPSRFRPGEVPKPRLLREPLALKIALLTHYLYFNALLTISWTILHVGTARVPASQQDILKRELLRTARSVLELTAFIDVAPSTPVWLLAVLPLSALMILFDLVVHNPTHAETGLSLALLDMAGGHFSRIEYASKGALPGSLVAEFAHLARQYVSDVRSGKSRSSHEAVRGRVSGEKVLASANAEGPHQGCTDTQLESAVMDAGLSQGNGLDAAAAMQPWSPASFDPIFFPFLDDPTYALDDMRWLGIDVMGLFDQLY